MKTNAMGVPLVKHFAPLNAASSVRYVGLDRDNTLIEDAGYTKLNQEPVWLPGVIDGLKLIHSLNYGLVIFTNQAALSKGLFSLVELNNFHSRMNVSLMNQTGFGFNSIFVCPHLHDQGCTCRKPRPGMFDTAKEIYGNLPQVMIGDSDTDIEAANSVGVVGIKVQQQNFLKVISDWFK